MKLQSMTDFVLQNKANFKGYKDEDYGKFAYNHVVRLENYAKFLKQPLKLEMFVPCDEDGQLMEEPKASDYPLQTGNYLVAIQNYQESNRCVLFEGFMLIHIHNKRYKQALVAKDKEGKGQFDIYDYETIEDLVFMDLTLTQTAIKHLLK